MMQQLKDLMLQQNENVMHREITQAEGQRVEIDRASEELAVMHIDPSNEDSEQSRLELVHELRVQQASNAAHRQMCEEAMSRTTYERTGQKIRNVKATDQSTAIAGIANLSEEKFNLEQDISGVIAQNQSFAGAGVFRNLDFANLRHNSSN
jgi:hypothetical protein